MSASGVDDVAEILHMASFLAEVGYRDLALDSNHQRIAVARRLWREGIDLRLLRLLRHYADACGQNPVRLFCWWLDRPSRTVEKVNEMRARDGWTKRALDRTTAAEPSESPAPIYTLRRKA